MFLLLFGSGARTDQALQLLGREVVQLLLAKRADEPFKRLSLNCFWQRPVTHCLLRCRLLLLCVLYLLKV